MRVLWCRPHADVGPRSRSGKAPEADFAATLADEYIVSQKLAEIFVDEKIRGMELEPVRDVHASSRNPKYQLRVVHQVAAASETRFGRDLVEPESPESDKCPLGHVVGLSLLSEVRVPRAEMADVDIAATKELLGRREGVLVPEPLILVSPRLRRLLIDNRVTGWEVERAHLV